ncbi:hypothetical protein PSECIP111951_03462 [Pseudoalteromonas holothuriae]|uniref:PDZ domain-containing protein n=1 Tax=Pseudoalteromonas holothuriae TaxID=2963714 RepID=A0ABN8UQ34_9GAMM|nr:aspartyl protease family protein [Pseudoalteromonas sp. CIP111951]CAH9065904.1 hypothetical protein PSECIP111951_03462 [Pseudoalteromonas sp. CIP111951]
MKIWLLVTLSIVLSGCSFVRTIGMKWANSDIEPVWQGQLHKQLLDSSFEGEKSYVNVHVNGHRLKLLIDSGASFSMLFDTPKVNAIGLSQQAELMIGGWGDEEVSAAYKTQVDKFTLGQVGFDNMALAVIPTSTSKYYLRDDEATFDGVLGHDVMRHFAWTFDKEQQTIELSRVAYQPPLHTHAIPFSISFSKVRLPAQFYLTDQHQVKMPIILDTGSRHYLKLSATYLANHNINITPLVGAADFGLSGRTKHQRGNITSIQLGDLKVPNVKANFIPTDEEDELWIIGNAFLNQFVTTVDYHTSILYLQPRGQSFKTRYNLSGLELRKIRSGHFVVRHIAARSAKFGLRVGDIITRINNQDVHSLSMDNWLDISNSPAEHLLCWAHSAIDTLQLHSEQCNTMVFANIIGFSEVY